MPSAIAANSTLLRAGEAARFSLPLTATPIFASLLRDIDAIWSGEYSLTVTSMEDVFIAASGGAVAVPTLPKSSSNAEQASATTLSRQVAAGTTNAAPALNSNAELAAAF